MIQGCSLPFLLTLMKCENVYSCILAPLFSCSFVILYRKFSLSVDLMAPFSLANLPPFSLCCSEYISYLFFFVFFLCPFAAVSLAPPSFSAQHLLLFTVQRGKRMGSGGCFSCPVCRVFHQSIHLLQSPYSFLFCVMRQLQLSR